MNESNKSQILSLLHLITSLTMSGKIDGSIATWLVKSMFTGNDAVGNPSVHGIFSNILIMFIKCDSSYSKKSSIGMHFPGKSNVISPCSEQPWLSPFKSFIICNIKQEEIILAKAAETNMECLFANLCFPEKQWCAFQILRYLTRRNQALYPGEDVVLPNGTPSRFDKIWKCGLHQQETSELEKNILTTAKWLPHHLMSDIESWVEKGSLREDEEKDNFDAGITFFLK